MNRYYGMMTAIILAFLPFLCIAQRPDTKAETIRHVIEETGVKDRIIQSVKTLQLQFESNPLGLDASGHELMVDLFRESFMTNSLMNEVRNTFEQQYHAEYANSVVDWLQMDTTRKVTKAGKEFYTLQGSRKRVVRMYELEQNSPSEERMKVIKSMIETTSVAESTVESYAIIFRSFITAFDKLSDRQTFSESQIDMFVDNYRKQIEPQVKQEAISHFMIKYYGLTDNTLRKFISFFQTEPGGWLNKATSKSIHNALTNAAGRFIASVSRSQ